MPSYRRSRITRSLSAGIIAVALAAPAAQAGPTLEPGSDSGDVSPANRQTVPDQAPVEPRAVTTVIDEGFDWGSAAIGAGGASMLILLSLGGAARVGGVRAHFHGA